MANGLDSTLRSEGQELRSQNLENSEAHSGQHTGHRGEKQAAAMLSPALSDCGEPWWGNHVASTGLTLQPRVSGESWKTKATLEERGLGRHAGP